MDMAKNEKKLDALKFRKIVKISGLNEEKAAASKACNIQTLKLLLEEGR